MLGLFKRDRYLVLFLWCWFCFQRLFFMVLSSFHCSKDVFAVFGETVS